MQMRPAVHYMQEGDRPDRKYVEYDKVLRHQSLKLTHFVDHACKSTCSVSTPGEAENAYFISRLV